MATLLGVYRTNTILYCRRWQETVEFYRDVLGMTVHHAEDWFVEFQVTNESFLSVAEAARATIDSSGGRGLTLSWQVDHLERVHRHLFEQGVDVGPVRAKWGARVFYFSDPEGHRIELWAP